MSATFLLVAVMLAGCEVKPELDHSLVLTSPAEAEAGESVLAAALSADGTYAAYTSVDGAVSVWDVVQQKEIRSWPVEQFGGGARFLKFTGGGQLLLMAGIDYSVEESERRDGDINYFMIWNIVDGTTHRIWTMKGARLTAVSPSGDGTKIAAGFSNGLIVVFDEASVSRSDYVLHTDKITDLQLSADGKYALSGSVDSKAHYWDVSNGKILHTFSHRNRVTNVAADDNFNVGFTSDALDNQRLWNLQTGELIAPLKHQQRWMYITNVRFSQKGDHLLIASPSPAVSIWHAATGDEIALWHTDIPVIDATENAQGNVVSMGSTGIVSVWKKQWQ